MAFGINSFKNVNDNVSRGLGKKSQFNRAQKTWSTGEEKGEVSFYNTDSLWSRWRRGYELYSAIQTYFGSTASEREKRGDYRVYFSFQQFPGVFIPARIFTFPSSNQELGEQLVGMRDADSFSFYDKGLPIRSVRYLGNSVSGTYSQNGTTVYITKANHGLRIGESIWVDYQTGSGVDETATIVTVTDNVIGFSSATSLTTSGNVIYYLSTTFGDSRWTTTRVGLAWLPTEVTFLEGERLTDRIVEKDIGISGTYSRSGSVVTLNGSSAHGLTTGNSVYVNFNAPSSGLQVLDGVYVVTVTSTTQLQITTIASGASAGSYVVTRRIRGRRYDDYVGYTLTGIDTTTKELMFQRKDSYGASTTDNKTVTTVPAHRGFESLDSNNKYRFLTTDLRWQCSCQDFSRRDSYDLYSELSKRRFPTTSVRSTKPGQVLEKDNTIKDQRDIPGTFRDLGFVAINNFYKLPDYEDTKDTSVQNLMYYQLRWCKHIYAAMFALNHDEGNDPIDLYAQYQQVGPNIEFFVSEGHNLQVNTRVQITFTSGSAESGDYIVTNIIDDRYFNCVYPFSNPTKGYCTITNLKKHSFVKQWLLEPNDKPVGNGLISFEKRFEKEKEKLQSSVELALLGRQSTQWSGQKEIKGSFGNAQSVADFDPSILSMTLTDQIRRNEEGRLSRSGKQANKTNRMVTLVNKLFNQVPTLLQDIKIGIINKPLDEYTEDFESGVIDAGEYLNGTPTEASNSVSTIDCSTYSPLTSQDTLIDTNQYLN